jgi:hypothetical protein
VDVITLTAMDTFGNCQRPIFSLGVSQHIHKNNKPVKIWTQLVINVAKEKLKKNTPLSHKLCFQMLELSSREFSSNIILLRNYSFLKNYTSEGAVSHNVLYYQQLSISRYQVIFLLTIILNNYPKYPVP